MKMIHPAQERLPAHIAAVEDAYRQRERRHTDDHARLASWTQAWSLARVLSFSGAAACIVVWTRTYGEEASWFVGAAIAAAAFCAAVFGHLSARSRSERAQALAAVNAEAVMRLHRRWMELPPPSCLRAAGPEMRDLNVVGHASLAHWLDTIATPPGRVRLCEWLQMPASANVHAERQAAVAELAPDLDARQQFFVVAGELRADSSDDAPMLQWAKEHDGGLPPYWVIVALTLGCLCVILVQLLGLTRLPIWIPAVLFNILVTIRYRGVIAKEFAQVDHTGKRLDCYSELMALICRKTRSAALLKAIRAKLGCTGDSDSPNNDYADRCISSLRTRIAMAELRHFWMYYLLAQPLLLWDFHCAHSLRKWRSRHGARIGEWLDALADFEVLATAASVRHDHPDWCFPVITQDGMQFDAQALGHPLIADRSRVCNDVSIGPERRLLIVGGSNMSGKSTLLRTLGCNVMLARCGAPICARRASFPPVGVLTSFRIQDSLSEGTSLFMAELVRIRQLLDQAQAHASSGSGALFLLDEVLHGTNSHERRVAVTLILKRLLEMNTLGAISTHDLELSRDASLRELSNAHHFREQLVQEDGGTAMLFDYRLHAGEATSSNALALLEAVGIQAQSGPGRGHALSLAARGDLDGADMPTALSD